MTALLASLLLGLVAASPPSPAPVAVTPHFRFHAADGADQNALRLAETAEARLRRLCAMIDACDALTGPIDVWLAEDADGFARAFGGPTPMAEWAVGVAFLQRDLIVLRAHGSSLFSLHETFDHEVSHVLLHAAVGGRPVPRWLSEGIAIWQAGEPVLERLVQAQRAMVTDRLLPLDQLEAAFPSRGAAVSLAYAQAALFVHHLERRYGYATLPRLVTELRAGADVDTALQRTTGLPLAELEAAWREDFSRTSAAISLLADPNLLWGAMSLLFLLASYMRWRTRRAELRAMADDEAAADGALWEDASGPPVLH